MGESRICDELLLLGKFYVQLPQFLGDFVAAVPYELLNSLALVRILVLFFCQNSVKVTELNQVFCCYLNLFFPVVALSIFVHRFSLRLLELILNREILLSVLVRREKLAEL